MTSALLVIDVQRGLCEGDDASFEWREVVARINRAADKARAAGAPVVFIQHESPGSVLAHGTPGWQLAPGLETREGDLFVRKTAADSFHKTNLQALLQERGADALVVCGMHSEFCVDTTTRRAAALGYPVTLVADAHTTSDKPHLKAAQISRHHNETLTNITSFGAPIRAVPVGELRFNP